MTVHSKRKLTRNKRKRPAARKGRNPLRIDPTRTITLRRNMAKELKKRFARLRFDLYRLVAEEDVFGLKPRNPFVGNAFCPTGEGGGVDPTCSPSSGKSMEKVTEDNAGSKLLEVSRELFGELPKVSQGFYESSATEGRILWRDGDRYIQLYRFGRNVRIDFGMESKPSSTYQSATLQIGSKKLADKIKSVVLALRAKGFGIQLSPSDDRRRDLYKKMLGKMGLTERQGVWNTRWRFHSDPDKIKAFQTWLKAQFAAQLIGRTGEELWERYIQEGFKKGAGRAFDDTQRPKRAGTRRKLDFYEGNRDQFLRSAFGRPVAVEKVKMMAGRSFNDLEGITQQMSTRMTRTLTDGLTQGKGARELARDLAGEVDIGRDRAMLVSRTELIRAHAEGQLEAFENLGVEDIGVAVEWETARDNAVCSLCEAMEGVVLKLDEAKGMIPRHPNCRCAFIPANVGEKDEEQKDTKRAIDKAVRQSQKLAGDDEGEAWGPGQDIAKRRPKSILNEELLQFSRWVMAENVFCPTGEGGGVDPTCSPGGSKTELHWAEEFRSVGGLIDGNGDTWLYHATTREKAEQIVKSGILKRPIDATDEYGVYLSSSPDVARDYGDGTVLKVKVKAADLNPDDVFPGRRMDFSIKTRKGVYKPVAIEAV